ncbi:phytase [Catenuloplanes atrovinosus]|uniref:3-phytase n=1 Tax=Catenuloplanes atrovinosus TaxID=137266 RepID=A0AAE3YV96_9ACTN|nr:phytase [Catenuloplanes atrovinosus]MDR7280310.1 3-phytase [Catenuloplanes atrovinosus]
MRAPSLRFIGAALAVPTLLLTTTANPAAAHGPRPVEKVVPAVETPALYDDEAGGDADADDPAIWVHPADRARFRKGATAQSRGSATALSRVIATALSRVIATAKNGGLRVYDLRGRELQSIATPPAPGPDDEAGRFNNVDIVEDFRLGGRTVDLAAVSDRGRDQLRFYAIDERTGLLTDVTAADVPFAFNATQAEVNEQRTAYGLDAVDGGYLLVSRRSTPEVGTFRLVERNGRVSYRPVDRLTLPAEFTLPDGTHWAPCTDPGDGPQVEGVVVDAENRTAYLAQEDVALWRVPIRDGRFTGRPAMVERVREFGIPATYDEATEECVVDYGADPGFGGRIAADVEGLTILPTGRTGGTLLVSSQGDDTFYTYDRRSNRPIGHFAVVDGPRVDGSQECDGAAVTPTPLPGFPGGLLVVHDGQNTPGDGDRPNTNFKFLDAGFLY